MLSVLIVDDEYRDRENISNIIQRQNWSVQTYTAENGENALKILKTHPIDIMLTDIRMPDMLGTELAEHALILYPNIKIILISAYPDFDYAQQGIRFGAINYILKPYLLEDFISAVESVINICKKEQNDPSNMSQNEQIFRDQMLLSLLDGNSPKTQSDIAKLIGDFPDGIQPIIIECLGIKPEISYVSLNNILSNVFSAIPKFFYLNKKRCLILITEKDDFISETHYSEELIKQFQMQLKSEVLIVFGRPVIEISDLADECCSLLPLLEICFFVDHSVVLSSDSYDAVSKNSNLQIEALTEQIISKIHTRDYEMALEDIHSVFEHLKKTNHISQLYVKYIFADVINQIFKNVTFAGAPCKLQIWLDRVFKSEKIYDIALIFEDLIKEIRECDNKSNNDVSQLINRIYATIEDEYMTNLSLDMLANRFYISSSYLSHIFKKETGENFIDYLKKYRIRKSCELLRNTNLKVSQICTNIGYESVSYFCSLFKSTYGLTPKEYRERGIQREVD